jgi:hypothetical protein
MTIESLHSGNSVILRDNLEKGTIKSKKEKIGCWWRCNDCANWMRWSFICCNKLISFNVLPYKSDQWAISY